MSAEVLPDCAHCGQMISLLDDDGTWVCARATQATCLLAPMPERAHLPMKTWTPVAGTPHWELEWWLDQ